MIVLNVPLMIPTCVGTQWGTPGTLKFFDSPFPRYCTCANLLTQDHWQIQGYSSSGHSINQGSLQKWTGGTHLHIWHTWLQWNHRILIVWIIFLVKVQWWKLAIKCPTRPYVCSTVCSYVRTSVCCNDILHTYIHNTYCPAELWSLQHGHFKFTT